MKKLSFLTTWAVLLLAAVSCGSPPESGLKFETITVEDIDDQGLDYSIHFTYPSGYGDKAVLETLQRKFITHVLGERYASLAPREAVDALVADIKEKYEEVKLGHTCVRYTHSDTMLFVSDTLLQIRMDYTEYFNDGWGVWNPEKSSFHLFNLQTGKEYSRSDIFKPESAEMIRNLIFPGILESEDIKKAYEKSNSGSAWIERLWTDTTRFALTPEGIKIAYSYAELGIPWTGHIDATITYMNILPCLREGTPVWNAVKAGIPTMEEFAGKTGLNSKYFRHYGVKLSELFKEMPGTHYLGAIAVADETGVYGFGTSKGGVQYSIPNGYGLGFGLLDGEENNMDLYGDLRVEGFVGKAGELLTGFAKAMTLQEAAAFFGKPVEKIDDPYGNFIYAVYRDDFSLIFHDGGDRETIRTTGTVTPDMQILVTPKLPIEGYGEKEFAGILQEAWDTQRHYGTGDEAFAASPAEFARVSKINPEYFAFFGATLSQLFGTNGAIRFTGYPKSGDNVSAAPGFGKDASADVVYLLPSTAGATYSHWEGEENNMERYGGLRITGFEGKLGKLFPAIAHTLSFSELGDFFWGEVEKIDDNKGFIPPHYCLYGRFFTICFNNNDNKNPLLESGQITPGTRIIAEPVLSLYEKYDEENWQIFLKHMNPETRRLFYE